MICALSFPAGKPFDSSALTQIIAQSLGEEWPRIRVFSPGSHELTLQNMPKANWHYTLEVRSDGCGTLTMVAQIQDVVTFDIKKGKMTGPHPGNRTVRLPGDEEIVLITAQEPTKGLCLFHILFYLSPTT